MNCENVQNVINENILPEIYETYINNHTLDNLPSFQDFLEDYNLSKNGVSHNTTWRWLLELGFEYKERKKSYFSDKHESDENIKYCKIFIEKYFNLELNTYRWVHIREDTAKKMEENEGLLKIYHEFVNEQNINMREIMLIFTKISMIFHLPYP